MFLYNSNFSVNKPIDVVFKLIYEVPEDYSSASGCSSASVIDKGNSNEDDEEDNDDDNDNDSNDSRVALDMKDSTNINSDLYKILEWNINNNWDYRQFMTQNGIEIMKIDNQESCYYLGLNTHYNSNQTPSDKVPFMYSSSMDTRNPGYGYPTSNLKNVYLTREELQAKQFSPSIIVKNK